MEIDFIITKRRGERIYERMRCDVCDTPRDLVWKYETTLGLKYLCGICKEEAMAKSGSAPVYPKGYYQ